MRRPPTHGFYRVLSRLRHAPTGNCNEYRLRHEEEDEKEGCIPVRRWCGGRAGGGEGSSGNVPETSPSGAVELAEVRVETETEAEETGET